MNIKVLQWNIWIRENPENIIKQLKNLNADIICIQEATQDSKKQLDVARLIADRFQFQYFFKEADTWDNLDHKETQGNAIFSRFPIVETFYRHVQKPKHNSEHPSHQGRVYVEIKTKINGKILTVGTTHLSYSYRCEITEKREKEIDNLINLIKSKKEQYILAADLNSVPNSYAIEKISNYLVNSSPNFNENTWTTKPFDYDGFKEIGLNWRIDYIFSSKDIPVISSKIINSPYSDHLPILSEFEIK